MAADHGDDGEDTESWLGAIAEAGEREREARANRISKWADTAGSPHAEITLGDDPEYMDRIGFWRVQGGVIRIRASEMGEFDPADGTDITAEEIKAIMAADQSIPVGLKMARAAKIAAKKAFADLEVEVVGVGVTRVDVSPGYGVKVNIRAAPAEGVVLPVEIEGVPVRVEVVGRIRKLEKGG